MFGLSNLQPVMDNIIKWCAIPIKLSVCMIKKFLHEPLVHFFLTGGLIFLLYSLIGADSVTDNEIIVNNAVIERLKATWQRQTNREPTPDELDGLLADYLFEELFYREARSLGLEQDDPIIRRRLVQKMTLLTETAAQQVQPDEAELKEWYDAHPDLYRTEPRLGFKHIYFSHDRRGGSAEKDASALLSHLKGLDENAAQPGQGDVFMLPHKFPDVGRSQLGRLFGEDFAATLFTLKAGNWQGPVPSGYGYHLVYLFDKQDARPTPFTESKTRVLQDRQRDKNEQVTKDLLEELKSRYEISYSEEVQALLNAE